MPVVEFVCLKLKDVKYTVWVMDPSAVSAPIFTVALCPNIGPAWLFAGPNEVMMVAAFAIPMATAIVVTLTMKFFMINVLCEGRNSLNHKRPSNKEC